MSAAPVTAPPTAASAAADEHAREYATDPRRSILLQAPAGSGKTTVLTQRLLRLLAEVEEPEEILAITFTRKAAAEMRARVLKALRGEIDTNSAQGRRLQALASAALERGAARGWNLAQDPGRLRIQTIDSFNFRLASQLPVTAKAGGALTITDRPWELYHRAARGTLVAAESDPALSADVEFLFERLDNNWHNVEELLADMLQKRGHWLRYVLGHEPQALCARINESLGNIVRDHLVAACDRLSAALRAEAGALPQAGGALESEPECSDGLAGSRGPDVDAKRRVAETQGHHQGFGPAYEADSGEGRAARLPRTCQQCRGRARGFGRTRFAACGGVVRERCGRDRGAFASAASRGDSTAGRVCDRRSCRPHVHRWSGTRGVG